MIAVFLIVPYFVWAFNLIPSYWMAQAAAGGLILLFILPGVLISPRQR
jgi:predicted Na+-dependent transporter